jgi:hypothetical protein
MYDVPDQPLIGPDPVARHACIERIKLCHQTFVYLMYQCYRLWSFPETMWVLEGHRV